MFKTVLVHLTGTDCDRSVLATALRIARPFGGHLDCVRMIPDQAALVAQAVQLDMGSAMLLSDTINTIEQQARERTERARATFAEFCKQHDVPQIGSPPGPGGVSASWREIAAADEYEAVTRSARFHDAAILAGGKERSGRLPPEFLGSIVISAGRPVVLAPEKPHQGDIKTIAVAWKNAAEAARALTAAMPLLSRAQRIDVLSASESDSAVAECLDCSDSVVRQLRWHGLNAQPHLIVPAGRTAPEAVLESAHGFGADLLVMGGYGHSRLREFVFGGFTHRILKGAGLPVFLFH
jgi:nucleotide-binding universal stress UspA family protein